MDDSWKTQIHIYGEEHKSEILERISQIVSSKGGLVSASDFSDMDTFHPAGHTGISQMFSDWKIAENSHVLDVGSGLGGTSRHIESTYNCSVLGLDYLPHFVEIASTITSYTKQSARIQFRQGDITNCDLEDSAFDVAIALGVFLIIPGDRGFATIHKALKLGGLFYVEDYFLIKDTPHLNEEEKKAVEDMALPYTRTLGTMATELERLGFEICEVRDFSQEWSEFAWNRSEEILKKFNDPFAQNKPSELEVFNYGKVSPRLLNAMTHLTEQELREKYPLTCQQVTQKTSPVSAKRLIARKIRD